YSLLRPRTSVCGAYGSLGQLAEQAQTADAAVREDVQAHVGDRAELGDLLDELVLGVHRQLLARQQLAPEQALGLDLGVGTALDVGALDRAAVRVVALEVQGVDHDALDLAGVAEGDYHPVVARGAAACGFPAVAHVHPAAGVEDVAHAAEVLVRAGQGAPAVEGGGQVDLLVVADAAPVAVGEPVHAQAGHATIRVDVEAQVGEGLAVADLVVVVAVALQGHGGQHFGPDGVVARVAF